MNEPPAHHGKIRDALIAAALALEPAHGPLGLSLREVARTAGVTHAAAYHWFENKEALFVAVADGGYARLVAALDAAVDDANDGFFAIVGIGVAYVRFALASPSLFRFMYGTAPASAAPLETRHDEVLERFARAVAMAQDIELVRRGPTDRAAAQFWSLAHGLATLTVAGALDGAPRANPHRRTERRRERRALDLARVSMVGFLLGHRPPDSRWRPSPPGRRPA